MVQRSTRHGELKIEDIEAGLLRQRRNLLVVSSAILIYELGGGTITSTSNFLGSITLRNPNVMLYAAWLTLVYAIWRYWLYREPGKAAFETEFINTINSMRRFQGLVAETKNSLSDNEKVDNSYPMISRALFKRYLNFNVSIRANEWCGPNRRKFEHTTYEPTPFSRVPYFRVLSLEVHAFLIMGFRNRAFSDYYLPYIMAWMACSLIVINHALKT